MISDEEQDEEIETMSNAQHIGNLSERWETFFGKTFDDYACSEYRDELIEQVKEGTSEYFAALVRAHFLEGDSVSIVQIMPVVPRNKVIGKICYETK